MSEPSRSLRPPLEGLTALALEPERAELVTALYSAAQRLLDDDQNLTPAGALNASARRQLSALIVDALDEESAP